MSRDIMAGGTGEGRRASASEATVMRVLMTGAAVAAGIRPAGIDAMLAIAAGVAALAGAIGVAVLGMAGPVVEALPLLPRVLDIGALVHGGVAVLARPRPVAFAATLQ